MAVIKNNGLLEYFGEDVFFTTYNLRIDQWDGISRSCLIGNATQVFKSQQVALVNPKTDIIYIPYGCDRGKQMLVLDVDNEMCSGISMPIVAATAYFAWGEAKDTLYMFGDTAPATGPTMWEFQPITKDWKKLSMQGNVPSILSDSCIVSGRTSEAYVTSS
ncbi:hypothetical protein BGZ95_002766 [Linnemannia exigua]|uniref:Uncharacterized protein n=1 Tax=Linnemannia exigua TaxID=604196 RepID=A0AAD4DLV2_9FUNG|nr:hypothetical protein BGZ95_002766 [Linnemannia exigua]